MGDCFTERCESMPDGELISVTINDGIKKFSELGRHDNSNDDKSKYKKVCAGDIAYNSMRMWQGASGCSPYEGIVSPAYTVLTPNSGINSKCMAYQFKLPATIHTFKINSQGITSDNWNLKFPALSEIEIYVSPYEQEQAKIAAYFANLDHLITLHQRKYDKLQVLKKAMLEKMFPKNGSSVPEIRFKGFTDAWEQRKLGEIVEIKDSARIPNNEWSDIGVPYIRASDISSKNLKGTLFISSERYEFYKNKTGAPMRGDVLFNGGGEIGKSIICNDSKPIYVQGGAVLYARTSASNELEASYLKTYYETSHSRKYIDAASAGGTMKHFTLKPAQEMPVYLPEAEEQKQIGDFYICIDNLITLHQRELEKLQNIKKSMLEKMFV